MSKSAQGAASDAGRSHKPPQPGSTPGPATRTRRPVRGNLAEIALWRTTLLYAQTPALRARAIAELRRLGVDPQCAAHSKP